MEPAKLSLPILEGVLGKYSIYLNLEYMFEMCDMFEKGKFN